MSDSSMVEVLDKGYVRLINTMGGDLSVVNAARASFAKESKEFSEQDAKLLGFLYREGHHSPFRHAFMTFEFKAPLMVARQHWKYIVGSDHTMDGWNESSRRYVTQDPEFYVPDVWRSAPENKKQGSGAPVNDELQFDLNEDLIRYYSEGVQLYEQAMADGVAAEQARLFLPAYGMYVNYHWSASLQSVIHFLNQRLEEDAQVEIQEYAKAVRTLLLGVEDFKCSAQLLIGA